MGIVKTLQLIDWLEQNHPGHSYGTDDIRNILSIAMAELADQNDKTFESLPYSVIEEVIEIMKAKGEFYYLDDRINSYKARFK